MATVARRTPPSSVRPTARTAPTTSSGYRGSVGIAKMHEEEQHAAARKEAAQMNANMPFRFFCEAGGATKEVVVVDYSMSEVFFRYEHNMKDRRSGKWSIFCACISENANCPVCKEAERPSYFAMFLTVIDLTPYVNKDDIEVPWSKKLLVVKSAQQKKITRIAERNGGNLRGVVLAMTRDGDKDAQIGNDIEHVDTMTEDDLLTYETTYEYKDSTGKQKVKEIIGHEVFDYDELFPMPTEQQLRAIVGGHPEPGSRDADAGIRRPSAGRRPPPDEFPVERPAPTRRTARSIPADDAPDVGADEPVYDEPAAPARSASPVARRTPPPQDEVYDDLPPDDEPTPEPPRRAAPAQRPPARPAPATMSRAAPARRAPAPDPEYGDAPQRGGAVPASTSLADRRRALRR